MRRFLLFLLIALAVSAWPPHFRNGGLAPSVISSASSSLALTSTPNIDIAGETSPDRQRVEPTIAVDPHNPSVIVAGAQDLRLKSVGEHRWHGYYRSTDGGQIWSSNLLPGYPGDTSPQGLASPLRKFNATSDPVLAFDRSGNLYYAGLALDITSSGFIPITALFVAKFANDGAVYVNTTLISAGIFPDKPWIAVDTTGGPFDGNVYVAYDANLTATSYFATLFTRSTDGGKTWSTPFYAPADETAELPGMAIDPSGNTYVSADAFQPATGAFLGYIEVTKITNGGTTIAGTTRAVSPASLMPSPLPGGSFRTFTIPQMAADQNGVYLVWDSFPPPGCLLCSQTANVMFTRSTDGGTIWSSPLMVNDVTTGQHFFPAISASGGTISVAWYDSRFNTGTTLTVLDVFLAQSTNAGVSFSPSLRVTNTSFNPETVLRTDPPNTFQPFMGDYIDIASFQGTVYPIWTDNRNACDTTDPVYGCVDQDIYTVPERVPVQVSFVSTLDSSTVTINGSLTVDRLLLKSGANLTVRAVATASGATTFTKTYSVSNLTMRSVPASGFQTRFLLNVPVLPYALSWDLAPNLQTIAASVNIVLTRELDIDGNGVVDIVDFSIVAFDYGSSTGSSRYNPLADFDADGIINIIDLSLIGYYYGAPVFF